MITETAPASAPTVVAGPSLPLELGRYAPVLRYDSQAPYRAVAVESITAHPGNELRRRKDTIASVTGLKPLDLDFLADETRDGRKRERLVQTGDPLATARTYQGDARYADRVYARAMESGGRLYLQYWLWFSAMPRDLLGASQKTLQGAWRAVHIELGPRGAPVRVLMQNLYAAADVTWDEVERYPGTSQPVLYVGMFDHHLRTAPTTAGGVRGDCDGHGREAHVTLEAFTGWEQWPGRWGADDSSPSSPGCTKSWERPPVLSRIATFTRWTAWLLGRVPGMRPVDPPTPAVHARLEHESAVVEYEFTKRPPARLLVTVHDDGDAVVGSACITNVRRQGAERIALPGAIDAATIRTSTIVPVRGRSIGPSATLVANEPDDDERAIFRSALERVLDTEEIERFGLPLGLTRDALVAVAEGPAAQAEIWRSVATDLQAFRDRRTAHARHRAARADRRRTTRWLAIWSAIAALMLGGAVVLAFVAPVALWVFAALWYAPAAVAFGVGDRLLRRRRITRELEETDGLVHDDPDGSAARKRFETALRERGIAPLLRQHINDRADDAGEAPLAFGAKGLTELRVAEHEVETGATRRLLALMGRCAAEVSGSRVRAAPARRRSSGRSAGAGTPATDG